MAECNGCGRTIDDKYEYCPHCGTRRGDFLLMKYNSLSQKEDKRKIKERKQSGQYWLLEL